MVAQQFTAQIDMRARTNLTPVPQMVQQSARRVVVIDDEAYICALVCDILLDEGYDVTIARNGEDGLHAIFNTQPHLVITDIMMPGISGLDVIQRMRTTPRTAHIPVIAMSAGRQPRELSRDILFISKPFDIDTFVAKVEEMIGAADDTP